MRTLLGYLVYVPLQILWLPLSFLGAGIVGQRQLMLSRKLGVSATGIEIINGRLTMHDFGMRNDPVTRALAKALPNTSAFWLFVTLLPLWVLHKIAGRHLIYPRLPEPAQATIADLVPARTVVFDEILRRNLEQAEQFVLMGAGYDSRGFGDFSGRARVFELDQVATQRLKKQAVHDAGLDASEVVFVEADFSQGLTPVFDELEAAGYESEKRSVFLWEGVTLYLSEKQVIDTMRFLEANAAPGSVLVADFYGQRMLELGGKRIARQSLEMTGEGLSFGLDFSDQPERTLRDFVEVTGLSLQGATFLGSASKKGPFVVVAELKVG